MAETIAQSTQPSIPLRNKRVWLYSIRTKLLLSFIFVSIFPLIVISIVTHKMNSKAAEDSAIKLLNTVLSSKESALNRWVEELQQRLHTEAIIEADRITAASILSPIPRTSEYTRTYKEHMDSLSRSIRNDQGFDFFLVLNPRGEILYSTNLSYYGLNLTNTKFFQSVLAGKHIYLASNIEPIKRQGISITEPVKDADNKIIGFVTGFSSMLPVNEIFQTIEPAGETIEVYLVGSDYSVLSASSTNIKGENKPQVLTRGTIDAILENQSGSGIYKNRLGIEVIGVYHWLPELGAAIFAEQSKQEIFKPTQMTVVLNSFISLILIVVTIIFGLIISNSIGKPLAGLVATAQKIAKGDISVEAIVHQPRDEISYLAETLNHMTGQLRENIGELERRVAERTSELEARTSQLLIASQLSNKINSILDLQELERQAVNLIRDRFNLYYVGLFLVDETNTWALLKAGTGPEGQAMIERGHRIRIGEGMIGWCIQNGRVRVSLLAGEDPLRLATPDLPETKSEVAVPLRSRGIVIGALTIQSTIPNAFDETILTTFQTMADQIAVAIDNARLFSEAEKSLEAIQRAYGEMSRKAWLERLRLMPLLAVRTEHGVTVSPITTPSGIQGPDKEVEESNNSLRLPIKVRGTVIGILDAQKPDEQHTWSEEEILILNTLTEQLGVALDSARLFEETRTRAERERLIGQITNRVRETLDIDTILQTATIEIQKAFDLDEVEVRMNQNIHQETML